MTDCCVLTVVQFRIYIFTNQYPENIRELI